MDDSENKLGTTISEEIAEEDFTRWAEDMGLESDIENYSGNDETVFKNGKKLFIRAITKGNAVVNDDGNFVYTVSDRSPDGYKGTDVEIKLPPPRAFITQKDSDGMKRILSIASGMTGKDTGWFMKLALPDFKFFIGIAGLFLLD